jgi:hypothetical protein
MQIKINKNFVVKGGVLFITHNKVITLPYIGYKALKPTNKTSPVRWLGPITKHLNKV